jgi:hypothetical protein
MLNKGRLFSLMIVGSFLVAGSAVAQRNSNDQPIVGLSTVTNYSVDGRVTTIDPATRLVTLTLPNSSTVSHKVGETVKDLGIVKVGDDVFVGFEERMTFVLSGPNTATPRDRNVTVAVGTAGSRVEAGVAASQDVASWWVVSTDVAASTVSLVNPNGGQVRTYGVVTSEGRAQLPRVKPGDSLTAINTAVLVVSIIPKKK